MLMERWAESQKMQAATMRAAVAIACGLGGKDVKPEYFLVGAERPAPREATWQQQKAILMAAFPPPPGYKKGGLEMPEDQQ